MVPESDRIVLKTAWDQPRSSAYSSPL